MIPRPPTSTLFPTRRSSDLVHSDHDRHRHPGRPFHAAGDRGSRVAEVRRDVVRSEEHTSELQSHSDLVCRLLLEKKKKNKNIKVRKPNETKTVLATQIQKAR